MEFAPSVPRTTESRCSWRSYRILLSSISVALLITLSLYLVFSDDVSSKQNNLLSFEGRNDKVVLSAELATENAKSVSHLGREVEAKSRSLARLQSLAWDTSDQYQNLLEPKKAAAYGLQAASAAREQFTSDRARKSASFHEIPNDAIVKALKERFGVDISQPSSNEGISGEDQQTEVQSAKKYSDSEPKSADQSVAAGVAKAVAAVAALRKTSPSSLLPAVVRIGAAADPASQVWREVSSEKGGEDVARQEAARSQVQGDEAEEEAQLAVASIGKQAQYDDGLSPPLDTERLPPLGIAPSAAAPTLVSEPSSDVAMVLINGVPQAVPAQVPPGYALVRPLERALPTAPASWPLVSRGVSAGAPAGRPASGQGEAQGRGVRVGSGSVSGRGLSAEEGRGTGQGLTVGEGSVAGKGVFVREGEVWGEGILIGDDGAGRSEFVGSGSGSGYDVSVLRGSGQGEGAQAAQGTAAGKDITVAHGQVEGEDLVAREGRGQGRGVNVAVGQVHLASNY